MLNNYNLTFKSGSILTKELLDKMYYLPKVVSELEMVDYSDGVISGLHFYKKDNDLYLSKGIYKHNGKLYLLEKDEKLDPPSGKFDDNYKYVILLEETNNINICENISINSIKFSIHQGDVDEFDKDRVVCSFIGSPKLPNTKEDLKERIFDMLYFKQSIYGNESTFRSELFKIIYDELLKKANENATLHNLDYSFMEQIETRGVVSCEFMRRYVKASGKSLSNIKSRKDLMTSFIESTDKIKGSSVSKTISVPVKKTEEHPNIFI